MPDSELTIGVAIPAYRNIESLRRGLLSIEKFAPGLAQSVVVVDDSGDGRIVSALRSHFPKVSWIIHEANCGFGCSANDAVAACIADIVVLLNDDVEIKSDPVVPLQEAFRDLNLFAVTFQSQQADGRFREGAKRLIWPFGLPRILHNPQDQLPPINGLRHSAYAVGGHAAFHRKRFLLLGGFDRLFEPFYWEDVDLCQRALNNGWPTIYRPDCHVVHAGTGAIRSAHEAQFIRETTLRNRILFARRHCPSSVRRLQPLAMYGHRTLSRFTNGTFYHAYHAACAREMEFQEPADIG